MNWTEDDIPSQLGRIAIVTGANSGIGFEAAKVLAAKGATVVMACRNAQKAETARAAIVAEVPGARLDVMTLDLADLNSVRTFAGDYLKKYSRLDLLINNAGVMAPPKSKTAQGFELQFGANHLGHFALTGLLMDAIKATPNARVVNVSSGMHRSGTIDFADLAAERSYSAMGRYSQSKLANLLFTLELNRRLAKMGIPATATAAHPGWSDTGLQTGGVKVLSGIFAQSAAMGALPTLHAAVTAKANEYSGPTGFMGMRGFPAPVPRSAAANDAQVAEKLWTVSEQMTGVTYL